MEYDFTLILSHASRTGQVFIDPKANYGYWERKDGSEGGGLWFDGKTLVDYDGAYELPAKVIEMLRTAGFKVDDE